MVAGSITCIKLYIAGFDKDVNVVRFTVLGCIGAKSSYSRSYKSTGNY